MQTGNRGKLVVDGDQLRENLLGSVVHSPRGKEHGLKSSQQISRTPEEWCQESKSWSLYNPAVAT